jgi:hypothetical protein
MAEKQAAADRAEDVARVARAVIFQMHQEGARLDVQEIYEAVAATFAHYHLDEAMLERLRVYVDRWVERVKGGYVPTREELLGRPRQGVKGG